MIQRDGGETKRNLFDSLVHSFSRWPHPGHWFSLKPGARSSTWLFLMGSRAKLLQSPSTDVQGCYEGTDSEVEQPELKLEPMWDASDCTHCPTMPFPKQILFLVDWKCLCVFPTPMPIRFSKFIPLRKELSSVFPAF